MKVLLVNGSPNENGCTFTGLCIIKEQLARHGVESEMFQVGRNTVSGCMSCWSCMEPGSAGKCAIGGDLVNTVAAALEEADGIVLGSPVHYAAASGAITAFCDRLFFSTKPHVKKLKFGAAVVSCRRGGNSSAFDQLNKYFTISQMPVVSSCYWNGIHGSEPDDVLADKEGVRILKTLANNMAYLIKCKHQSGVAIPEDEPFVMTNFIR